MATTIQVRDLTTAELQRIGRTISPAQLALVGARGVANAVREHFRDLEQKRPNKMGWPRQHFWGGARQSVQVPSGAAGNIVSVTITKPGVALLYFGGIVRPKPPLIFLTIPAVPEAYGTRARERFDLSVDRRVNPATGFLQFCLVENEQSRLTLGPRSKKTGQRRFKGKRATGRVIFWLARKVRIKEDPTVLPTETELVQAAGNAIEGALQRVTQNLPGGDLT